MIYFYPSRSWCSILDDMRKMHKTHNYSQLESVIEELQYAGNRMEAALSDYNTIKELRAELKKLKGEYKELKKDEVKSDDI